MNINEFRKQYPQYNDVSDKDLTQALHKKYYSDMNYNEFSQKFLGNQIQSKPQFNIFSLITGRSPYPIEQKIFPSDQYITEQLPTIGMIGGGTVGGILGSPFMAPVGAGLGTGIMKSAQEGIESLRGWQQPQDIEKTTPEIYYDIGKEMIYGSAIEMGGGIAGKAIEGGLALGKPLAKKGVEKLLVKGAEKIPPGSWFFKKWRGKLNEQIINANKQYTSEVLGLPQPGMRIAVEEEKRALFDKLPQLAGGKDAMVEAPNVLKYIDDNWSAFAFVKRRGTKTALAKIRKDIISAGGKIEFKDLNNLSANVWGGFRKMTPAETRLMGGLRQAIKEDMYNISPQVGETFERAMDKSGLIHRMYETKYIENMFKRSMDWDPDKGVYVFAPGKFRVIVDQSMPKLQGMFRKNPEIPEMINQYADSLMNVSYDLAQFRATKPTGFLEIGAMGAAGVGAAKTGLIVPYGFETMMAHSLAHPRGWMKQWFKGTLKLPTAKGLTEVGTKGIGLNLLQQQGQSQ